MKNTKSFWIALAVGVFSFGCYDAEAPVGPDIDVQLHPSFTAVPYPDDFSSWSAAVMGKYVTEDFDDLTVGAPISVTSPRGTVIANGPDGFWWDYLNDHIYETVWTFAVPIYGFGGEFDLGSSNCYVYNSQSYCIGGPGTQIEVFFNGSWQFAGTIPNSYIDKFWGFVSDEPFTQIRFWSTIGGGIERYSMDDLVYATPDGFVTGGGWIDSPADAYKPDPALVGMANFGFVAKYKKNSQTPDGNAEFQFHAGDMNFHSNSYDWLVVTGGNYAKFKGDGTVNGVVCPVDEGGDPYKFMLSAGDDEPDTFRIKIWCEDEVGTELVLYDNGHDQEIAGGSIVIHTNKKK